MKIIKIIIACLSLCSSVVNALSVDDPVFVEHSAVMLVINPQSGQIIAANKAAAKFYGFSRTTLEAMLIQDINQLNAEQVAEERSLAASEGRNYFIFRHRLADDTLRTVSVYSTPFVDGAGQTQLLSIIHDISAQRALQDSLWYYQNKLEEQVAAQTQEIQQMSSLKVLLLALIIAILLVSILVLGALLLRLRAAKRRSEAQGARLKAIFNGIDDLLIFTDERGQILSVNKRVQDIFSANGTLLNKPIGEVLHRSSCVEQTTCYQLPYTLELGNGQCTFSITKTTVLDINQQLLGYIYVLQDITERLAREREQRLAQTVFDTTTEGVLVSDRDNRIQMVNRAFSQITGFESDEVLGQTPAMFNSGHHSKAYFNQLYQTLNERGHWEGEIWNRRKTGDVYPSWLQVSAVFDEQGDIEMYVALFNDITSRKHHEQLMWQQANFDTLTGLANRHHYHEKFDTTLAAAKENHTRFAICFIDLDRFKAINDTLGHHIGDLLLIEAAQRIQDCTRSSDVVARLGGDEFAILLTDIKHTRDVEAIANKILHQLRSQFVLEGHEAFVSGSIGITFYPDDGDEREVLLRNADSAMYKAKEHGRNCFQFYTSMMHENAKARSQLEGALHKALINEELSVVYQPILGKDNERIGCEALLRWHSETLGDVSPGEFIPVSEELGLILAMGEWVLFQACKQAKHWYEKTKTPFFVTVNVSSTQFKRQDVSTLVATVLRETGLPSHALTLEITENVLADNSERILTQLRAIRDMGVELAIDDFGTGYSSLSYLKRFPLSKLKIDQEFIRDLPHDAEDRALVSAIISMAANLNLQVVAEGVETAEQLGLLKQLDCDFTQGYLHAQPLSPDEFDVYLARFNEGC
ncbi:MULTISPECIES: EAL domain-containing protein [Pseudoalteromonas]|uniref:Diguanylate cyclase n=1 Tax=Pseudoalteromonas amylolytica TaxID=1859457 RepID=A0A1S1MUE2_9GAMM|nr:MULTISPECIES: EAL domain-containing protein [Pseudoalteromonas]OHU84578.1 diguanylate cyclase [Pseudoalteromonas sp. JW3]OHU92513.1 diguanylate cyclase [Pseudoalteromonas amylolytica]